MERVVGRAGETDFPENQLMSTRQQATLPRVLSTARRQFDQWRSRHRKHTRLPQELWRQAAFLAGEHGLNKTSRALGLKYYSLKKHLDQMTTDQAIPARVEPDFIELVSGVMTPGIIECTIEWADGGGSTLRMHIKGAGLSELASLAGVLRGGRA
jgi:hypothetical protein